MEAARVTKDDGLCRGFSPGTAKRA